MSELVAPFVSMFVQVSLTFIFLFLINIVMDKDFRSNNIVHIVINSNVKTLFSVIKLIQTRSTQTVSIRQFILIASLVFISTVCFYNSGNNLEIKFAEVISFYLVGSYVNMEFKNSFSLTFCVDHLVERWIVNSAFIVILLSLTQIEFKNEYIGHIIIFLILPLSTKTIFKNNQALDSNNSQIRLINAIWVSTATYMVVRYLLSFSTLYYLSLESTTYLITLLILLINIYLSRQTVLGIQSTKSLIPNKFEIFYFCLLFSLGALDWII